MFDSTCALMILFNSVIIGVDVQHMTSPGAEETTFSVISGHICSCFFLFELILRMSVQGIRVYFTNENRNWNLFDTVRVGFSSVDVIMEASVPAEEETGTSSMSS